MNIYAGALTAFRKEARQQRRALWVSLAAIVIGLAAIALNIAVRCGAFG